MTDPTGAQVSVEQCDREAQDKRRYALIERIGTIADLTCQTPLQGQLGDIAYDLLRQAAAQISSDRHRLAVTQPPAREEAPFGWKLVPTNPHRAQWDGLARAIMMWADMEPRTPRALFKHLERSEIAVPQWLRDEPEMQALDHVPSKGTRACLIYQAMLAASPTPPTTGGNADAE